MVVRHAKRNRKYHGTRRWGMGNIKNARGAGDRGGVGRGGIKHKWTYVTAKAPETIRTVGFKPWRRTKPKEITLREINRMIHAGKAVELNGYKVLSNGEITKAATIKATAFSKSAIEKIKSAGGEAVVL
ncbi:MAG: mitochondrial large ribosomal subunit protein uL15m [Candidatus Micrarchaeota archaeon]|nr:mitochondrial large ribosomal subunit protein uL15m [Candidatus Micrarchaeota archaeon]